jgi:hypothetical protein
VNAETALREILRRGQDIIAGRRMAGRPRAVAFDVASIAGRALGIEARGADAVQGTWHTPEQRPPERKEQRRLTR